MTGVTALVRGTAYMMEKYGMTYPALDMGDILRSADITHISNEIPFTETCPNPFYNSANDANLVFCSKPEYIALLDAIGTDVVELTGDHFRDWGADAMLSTLDMYDQRGWEYYGGGRNLADGQQPALFEHNGNKIAFLGCNAKPEGYATAGIDYPGAVHCDMDEMAAQIKAVKTQGYIPVVTFQHIEYYAYTAVPFWYRISILSLKLVQRSSAAARHISPKLLSSIMVRFCTMDWAICFLTSTERVLHNARHSLTVISFIMGGYSAPI
jgi:poly-gamma-glutamate synthesis protein (capsule biosynthesis protein)